MRFLTNFDKNLRPIYEKAIAEYGDPDFVIKDEPNVPDNISTDSVLWLHENDHSLWHAGEEVFNASEFWKVQRRIQAKAEAAKRK